MVVDIFWEFREIPSSFEGVKSAHKKTTDKQTNTFAISPRGL